MARLLVITDPDTGLGFRLAGLDTIEVTSAEEAAERLLALLKGREPGVVIYSEEYRRALPEKAQAVLEESLSPVFFAVPIARARQVSEPREAYGARLVRRAIGYQVKLKR